MRKIIFILAIMINYSCFAETIYVKPDEVVPTIIGQQLGNAAGLLIAARRSSIARQSKIAALRASVSSCGNCSSAASLKNQLDKANKEEYEYIKQADSAFESKETRYIFNLVIDPLHIKSDEDARISTLNAQRSEREKFTRNLTNNYCYATTKDIIDENTCLKNISLQDFVENEQYVLSNCEKNSDANCAQSYSLIGVMEKSIIERCQFSNHMDAISETSHLIRICAGRTPPPDTVESKILSIRQVLIFPGHDLTFRDRESKIFNEWADQNKYNVIYCYYSNPGISNVKNQIIIWYGEAPAGISNLMKMEKDRYSTINGRELGMLNLGSLAVSSCPNSLEDAQAFLRRSAESLQPANDGTMYPIQEVLSSGDVRGMLGRLVPAQAYAQNVANPVLSCKYSPLEELKSETYFYWKGQLPMYWSYYEQARREWTTNYAKFDFSVLPGNFIGTQTALECPSTLTDARQRAMLSGQKGLRN